MKPLRALASLVPVADRPGCGRRLRPNDAAPVEVRAPPGRPQRVHRRGLARRTCLTKPRAELARQARRLPGQTVNFMEEEIQLGETAPQPHLQDLRAAGGRAGLPRGGNTPKAFGFSVPPLTWPRGMDSGPGPAPRPARRRRGRPAARRTRADADTPPPRRGKLAGQELPGRVDRLSGLLCLHNAHSAWRPRSSSSPPACVTRTQQVAQSSTRRPTRAARRRPAAARPPRLGNKLARKLGAAAMCPDLADAAERRN